MKSSQIQCDEIKLGQINEVKSNKENELYEVKQYRYGIQSLKKKIEETIQLYMLIYC